MADWLGRRRAELGYSQERLARKLADLHGKKPESWRRQIVAWEKGENEPSRENRLALERALEQAYLGDGNVAATVARGDAGSVTLRRLLEISRRLERLEQAVGSDAEAPDGRSVRTLLAALGEAVRTNTASIEALRERLPSTSQPRTQQRKAR